MRGRGYGQFCGVARALELVGERWTLLIVRDLLTGPRRYTDLRRGLPRIPTNILADRLKELEINGIVRRRVRPRPDGSLVYELTEHGADLEDVVLALGRWGSRVLNEPGPDEIVTSDSLVMALRTTFQPEAAMDTRLGYELRFGPIVIHAVTDHGKLSAGADGLDEPDLVIETGPALRALMAGELSPEDSLSTGQVRITGAPALLTRFTELFRIMPVSPPASH